MWSYLRINVELLHIRVRFMKYYYIAYEKVALWTLYSVLS